MHMHMITRLLRRRWALALAFVLGAALVAAGDAAWRMLHRPGAGTLAIVDGHPITLQAFQQEMQRRGGEAAFITPEQRRALLDDMIRVAVLASNAQKAGYLSQADVRREIDRILAAKYEKANIDAPLANLEVTSSDVEQYYRDNLAAYTTPAAAHAAVIVITVPPGAADDARHALAERAAHVHQLVTATPGAPTFGALARQYSDDEDTAPQDGDIGWLLEGQENPRWEPPVLEAVFALDTPGDVSPVLATPTGFFIVKILETRPASRQPLAEVRGAIRQQLIRAERQRAAAKLYAAALAKVEVNVSEAGVAAMEAAERAIVGAPHRSPGQPQG